MERKIRDGFYHHFASYIRAGPSRSRIIFRTMTASTLRLCNPWWVDQASLRRPSIEPEHNDYCDREVRVEPDCRPRRGSPQVAYEGRDILELMKVAIRYWLVSVRILVQDSPHRKSVKSSWVARKGVDVGRVRRRCGFCSPCRKSGGTQKRRLPEDCTQPSFKREQSLYPGRQISRGWLGALSLRAKSR